MSAETPSVASLLSGSQQGPGATNVGSVDNLTCQWDNCGERTTSPETLYEHVCERHVGRKSTNNLNLQCHWGTCRTNTVKRDHITSHIRVHVPLKPHKCEFCGKSFKRPQDLKKHVKTHADDSVLVHSPGGNNAQRGPMNGYQPGTSKDPGFYGAGNPNHNGGYGYPQTSNGQAMHGAPGPNGGYGPVYYQMPQNGFGDGLTETRKRNHDVLDQFFGDAKRRQIDPRHYMDLGAQFGGLQGLPIGVQNGYQQGPNGNYNGQDVNGTTVAYAMNSAPSMTGSFDMPFQQLKTKNDLMSIDQFLEQLQNTVYESPRKCEIYGHPDPGIHTGLDQGIDPNLQGSSNYWNKPGSISNASDTQSLGDTPALTPSSQMSSHSPHPQHAQYSPGSRSGIGYPQLPPVSAHDISSGHFVPTSAPPSGLASGFEQDLDGRRRYSGGYLQRAQPSARSPGVGDVDSTAVGSPSSRRGSSDRDLAQKVKSVELNKASPSTGDGSARRDVNGADESANSNQRFEEAWVQNIRVIEALRGFVRNRLEHGAFEDNDVADDEMQRDGDGGSTPRAHQYPSPTMRDTEMGSVDRKDEGSSAGLYPQLPGRASGAA